MSDHANQPQGRTTKAARGQPADTYLAECYWPGVTAAKLGEAATRAAEPSEATCLQLILIPDDEIVLGLFHAPSEAAVTRASRRAGLPAERIVRSLNVRPHDSKAAASADRDRSPGPTSQPHQDASHRHH
jgi:hypothetical protein